jgi:predicted dehydrogenase
MRDIKRREFLGAALAATATAQMPPSKIRVGILGIQHSHLTGKLQAMYDHPDYQVVAVCEPDAETRKRRESEKLLQPLRWMSMDDMLGDSSLNLVVFEGEVKDAIPFGMRVLNAGKHLHLEKPPSNKLEPFRELVESARRRKLLLQLGYMWRFHAGIDTALEAYQKGWLGEVFMIRATINSDRDARQRAVETRYPGGSMFELGGHVIDRVVAFLGKPTRVQTWLRHDTSADDQLKDNTLAVFEYSKALATVISSAKDAASNRSFEVIGTDGTVIVNPMEPAAKVRVTLRAAQGPYKKGAQELQLPPQPRYVDDFKELARAIKSGTPLKYSYDHELTLQETLLRASGEIV